MKFYYIILFMLLPLGLVAQVGIGTATPDPSAALDIRANSNDKGLLIPRLTISQRNAISGSVSPANGLLIFQTDSTPGFYYYSTVSASWVLLGTSSGGTDDQNISGSTFDSNSSSLTIAIESGTNEILSLNSLEEVFVGAPPASPSTGYLLYNTGTNKLQVYDGSWIDVSSNTDSQTLTALLSGTILELLPENTGGTSVTVDLASLSSTNTDSQTLVATLSGTILELLPDNVTTTVTLDLSSIDTNTDTDSQTIVATLSGTILQLLPENTTTTATVDLASLSSTNTDSQTLVATLSGTILELLPDNVTTTVTLDLASIDTNTDTDSQTIVATLSGTILELLPENTTTTATVDLASLSSSSTDSQTLVATLSGTILELLPDNVTTTVTLDLASIDTNTDTDSQTIVATLSGTILQLLPENTTTTATVDLASLSSSSTDSQTLVATLSGTILELLPDNVTTTVTLDLASIDTNTDTDSQTIVATLSGTILQLLPENTTTTATVDLASLSSTNTDSQTLVATLSGTILELLPDNVTTTVTLDLASIDTNTDTDSQTIVATLSGTILELLPENTTTTATVDLASLSSTNTDSQTLTALLSGTTLQLLPENTGGTSVTVDLVSLSNTDTQTLQQVTAQGTITTDSIEVGGITVSGTAVVNGDSYLRGGVLLGGTPTDIITVQGRVGSSLIFNAVGRNIGSTTTPVTTIYSEYLTSAASKSVNLDTTDSSGQVKFLNTGVTKAGVNSTTFYVGDTGSNYYEFPRGSDIPGTPNNQVLAYTASNQLSFVTVSTTDSQTLQQVTAQGTITTDNIRIGGLTVSGTTRVTIGDDTSSAYYTLPLGTDSRNSSEVLTVSTTANTLYFAPVTYVETQGLSDVTSIESITLDDIQVGGLTVSGTTGLTVGESGDQYIFPTIRGTAGQVLTVSSTSTGTLVFEDATTNTDTQTLTQVLVQGNTATYTMEIGGLTVSGTTGLTVGESGNQYIFPTTRGTEGQVLTVSSTSTGTLVFEDATTNTDTQTLQQVLVQGNTTTNTMEIGGLTVSGTTGLTVGESGDQYIFPTIRGTAGQVLTVSSTSTGTLVFEDATTNTDTQTLTQVLVEGSTTTYTMEIGGLTVSGTTGLTVGESGSQYTFPTTNGGPNMVLTVSSTATNTLVFSPSGLPSGSNNGDIIHYSGSGWESTDELVVPFGGSGPILTSRSIEPKTNNDKMIGSTTNTFNTGYFSEINSGSGSASLTFNTAATGTPTISFQNSSTEIAGIGSSTFFIGDSSTNGHYFFPKTIPSPPLNFNKILVYSNLGSNTLYWSDYVLLSPGTTSGQLLEWDNGSSQWVTSSNINVNDTSFSNNISVDRSVIPSTSGVWNLGQSGNNFNTAYVQEIDSDSNLLVLSSTASGTPAIQFNQGGSEVAGIGSGTLYVGDSSTFSQYYFPTSKGTAGQVLTVSNTVDYLYFADATSSGTDTQTLTQVLVQGNTTTYTMEIGGLTVSGTTGLTLGESGDQYIFPTTRGTAGQVLTVSSTSTGTLVFQDATTNTDTQTLTQVLVEGSTTTYTMEIGGLTVSGTTGLTVGESGDQYIFPTTRGTAGQVLTVSSTSTGTLIFSSPSSLPTASNEGATLRWDGLDWVESTDIRIAPGSSFTPSNTIWIDKSLIPSSTLLDIGQSGNSFDEVFADQYLSSQNSVTFGINNGSARVNLKFDGDPSGNLILNERDSFAGQNNTAYGYQTFNTAGTTGDNNVAIGHGVLQSSTGTGGDNVGIGVSALRDNTSDDNVAVGYNALIFNSGGTQNVAVGSMAMDENTSGLYNTAIGYNSLNANTSGDNNVAIGREAMATNTTGQNNIIIGTDADVGANNLQNAVAIGFTSSVNTSNTIRLGNNDMDSIITSATLQLDNVIYPNVTGTAGQVLTVSSTNTKYLYFANASGSSTTPTLDQVTTQGSATTNSIEVGGLEVVGSSGLVVDSSLDYLTFETNGSEIYLKKNAKSLVIQDNTTTLGGSLYNTAFGLSTLPANATGIYNSAFGFESLKSLTSGSNNSSFGYQNLKSVTTGVGNTAFGWQAGTAITTGSRNTAFGQGSLIKATSASSNVAIGVSALSDLTTGTSNIALGYNAGQQINGTRNIAIGYETLTSASEATGNYNIGVGYRALYNNNSGTYNIAIGENALGATTTSSDNVSIGSNASRSSTGSSTISIGKDSNYNNTSGFGNVIIGNKAGYYNSTGSDNILIGRKANGVSNYSGSNNILIGAQTDLSTSGIENSIVIGNGAFASSSNTIVLGNGSVEKINTQAKIHAVGGLRLNSGGNIYNFPTTTGSNGQILTVSSTTSELVFLNPDKGNLNEVTTNGSSTTNVIQVGGIIDTSLGDQYELMVVDSGDRISSSNELVFTSSGLGIGTSVPSRTLHLDAGSDEAVARLMNTEARLDITLTDKSSSYTGMADFETNLQDNLIWFDMPGTTEAFVFGGSVNPYNTDDDYTLGKSYARWEQLFAQIATSVSSDRRLKDQIKDIDYGLEHILKLNPKSYIKYSNFNKTGDSNKELGFIAQEVLEVLPEVVDVPENKNGTYGLTYDRLIPVLTQAIKDQQSEIEKLQSEVKASHSEIQDLNKKLEKIYEKLDRLSKN